jgi:hypothetical protein
VEANVAHFLSKDKAKAREIRRHYIKTSSQPAVVWHVTSASCSQTSAQVSKTTRAYITGYMEASEHRNEI